MSPRPGRIEQIIEVDLPRPRGIEARQAARVRRDHAADHADFPVARHPAWCERFIGEAHARWHHSASVIGMRACMPKACWKPVRRSPVSGIRTRTPSRGFIARSSGGTTRPDAAAVLDDRPDLVIALGRGPEAATRLAWLIEQDIPMLADKPIGLSHADVAPLADGRARSAIALSPWRWSTALPACIEALRRRRPVSRMSISVSSTDIRAAIATGG